MGLFLFDLFGNTSIGIYSLATNEIIIVPPQVSTTKTKKLEEWLKVKVIRTAIGGSVLIGAFTCANSNGIILPHYVREEEVCAIKQCSNINITVMETKRTAYGNLILANDYGALVDPRLKKPDVTEIADTLCVEIVASEIAGLPYVGSLATATNKGVLAHPLLKEEEQKILKDVLKVPVDFGTVNCGIPYVATGLVANVHGAIAGYMTTGPELFIIGQALDIVEEEK